MTNIDAEAKAKIVEVNTAKRSGSDVSIVDNRDIDKRIRQTRK